MDKKKFRLCIILHIYINHHEKIQADVKVRFMELDEMNAPDWIVTPFELKIENSDIEFYLQEELIYCVRTLKLNPCLKALPSVSIGEM